MLEENGETRKILDHFRELRVESEARIMTVEDLQGRHPGLFDDTAFEGQKNAYVNTSFRMGRGFRYTPKGRGARCAQGC